MTTVRIYVQEARKEKEEKKLTEVWPIYRPNLSLKAARASSASETATRARRTTFSSFPTFFRTISASSVSGSVALAFPFPTDFRSGVPSIVSILGGKRRNETRL